MLTQLQQRQLVVIDDEFARRGLNIRTHVALWSSDGPKELTIAFEADSRDTNWYRDIYNIYKDIERFHIPHYSSYMIEMLRRTGVFGVSICGERDDVNTDFGAFVAKARLLKHIKNTRGVCTQ